ncbi:MAG: GNAT family N-acetyltransferase [Sphingomonas sp.]
MSDLSITAATAADLAAIHSIVESAYRGDSARAGWTHEADLLAGQRTDAETLAAIFADRDQRLLVARDATGDVIGSVVIERKNGATAYLGMLAVTPARQTGGVGRTLIAAAEAAARDIFGAQRIEMTVIGRRRELVAYYQRRGYALTGEQRPFPYDNRRLGEPLSHDLDFVVLAKELEA